jgi:secreted Zn-dependent insulinase-like peptidase
MLEKVKNLSDEEFKTTKNSVLTVLAEKDKNMGEAFRRDDTELRTCHYRFDRQDKECALL